MRTHARRAQQDTATDAPGADVGEGARRPIQARKAKWAGAVASGLARSGVTPNQISVASVLFALAAGASLVLGAHTNTAYANILFPVAAALFIQLRLLCNLFDGMVAVEGGRGTKSGEVFNDFPDRIADPLILIGAGYAITSVPYGSELGWAAALLAVLTAYIRVLGGSMGLAQSFIGPMAKQHRMALMTLACLAQALEGLAGVPARALPVALALIVVGCVVTVCRRAVRIVREAEA